MLKKLTLGIMTALILALAAFGVQAQDAIAIADTVTGELTEDNFAVEYTYNGKKDEVVVIEMIRSDLTNELSNPALILRDQNGDDLVRYDGYSTVTIIALLPEDGEYTIVATRTDDAAGTSVGEYTLSVLNPAELEANDSVDMAITSEEIDYFVYRGDADFVLSYVREGEYGPEFSVNTIDTEILPGQLSVVAAIRGKVATQGSVGIIPGGEVYVIRVGRSLLSFDFYFNTVDATYTLQLSEAGS